MPEKAIVTGSESASEGVAILDPLANLTDAEHLQWLKTGDLPKPVKTNGAEGDEGEESDESKDSETEAESEPASGGTDVGGADRADGKSVQTQQEKGKENKHRASDYARQRRLGEQITGRITELKELTGQAAAAKAELEAARAELARVTKETAGKTAAIAPEGKSSDAGALVRPRMDDPKYKTFKDYDEAKDAYFEKLLANAVEGVTKKQAEAIESRLAGLRKQEEDAEANVRKAAEDSALREDFSNKVREAKKRHSDIVDVIFNSGINVLFKDHPEADAFVLDSDHSPELLYKLASDMKEAKRIIGLPPLRALRELTLMEAAIASESKGSESKTPRGAKPPSPIGGAGGGSNAQGGPDETFAQYKARRDAEDILARKR